MNKSKTLNFLCNYDNKNINEYMKKFIIKDYHNIKIDCDNYDYNVIINHPYLNNKLQDYDKDKTIYVMNEPALSCKKWNIWKLKENFLYNNKKNWCNWNVDINVNDLLKDKIIKDENNKNKVTCVTSDLIMLKGHKLRVNFLRYFDQLEKFNIKPLIYGRKKSGIYDKLNLKNHLGDIDKRQNALLPYYYNFMGENIDQINYFTEKILDPIVCETLCFYWGCPNIKNYLHEKSFINVDLEKPNIALDTIIKSIQNNEYEKRLKYIKETKKKILYELNPMTLLESNIAQL